MADQPQSERTPANFVDKSIEQTNEALEPQIRQHDPINRAARELVRALIDSRWSLQAAAVVVALRRLCETVEGKEFDALFPSSEFIERIPNPCLRLQPFPAFAAEAVQPRAIDVRGARGRVAMGDHRG